MFVMIPLSELSLLMKLLRGKFTASIEDRNLNVNFYDLKILRTFSSCTLVVLAVVD